MHPITILVFYSLIGGLLSLVGALILTWQTSWAKKIMTPLLAFSAGAFLAAAFLDVLPEALELASEPHPILLAALMGFLVYFALERYLMRYIHKPTSEHQHGDHTESLPFMLVLGDSVHNFIDGLAIGVTYLINPVLGFTTTLAVAAHEIPQEIGDAAVLIHAGWKRRKIIIVNIAQSLLTVAGAILGYYTGTTLELVLPTLLAAVGGVFFYIAASDLIPEVHHQSGHLEFWRVLVPMVAAIAIIWFLVNLAQGA